MAVRYEVFDYDSIGWGGMKQVPDFATIAEAAVHSLAPAAYVVVVENGVRRELTEVEELEVKKHRDLAFQAHVEKMRSRSA